MVLGIYNFGAEADAENINTCHMKNGKDGIMEIFAQKCLKKPFNLHPDFQSHFELVRLILALEATEPVSELVTQMEVELINNHLISVQQ
jgi:hypothetical protein